MLGVMKTFRSKINAKIHIYNTLINYYIATVAIPKVNARVEQVREQMQKAANDFQIREQIQVREQAQAQTATDIFQNELVGSGNRSDVQKTFVKNAYEIIQLAQSFAEEAFAKDVEELTQLAQTFVAEANQIWEQTCQLDQQCFDRIKDLKESIECDEKKYKLIINVSIEAAGATAMFIFSIIVGLANSLPTFLPVIIAESATGGMAVVSIIIALFVAYTSAHESMDFSDALKKQNDALEEQDNLKLRETNDSLSEISENSDPCSEQF
jgi:hypothetical protein